MTTAACPNCKEHRKKAREYRLSLEALVRVITQVLERVDATMKVPSTEQRGRNLAGLMNELDMAKDRIRFFTLGIDFRTGKPRKLKTAKR